MVCTIVCTSFEKLKEYSDTAVLSVNSKANLG